jgi:hypothetical protein
MIDYIVAIAVACVYRPALNQTKKRDMGGEHFRDINQPRFYRGQKRRVPSDQFVLIRVDRVKAFISGFLNILRSKRYWPS